MRDYREEFWRGLEELRKSQKGTDRKIKETDGRLRETDRIIKKVGSMLSDPSFSPNDLTSLS